MSRNRKIAYLKKKKKKAHCWWERVGFEWRSRWGWSNRQGQGTNAAKDCCMRSSENRELRTEKDKKGLRQMNAADREEQVLVNANTWVGNKLTETAWSGSCVYNVFTVKVLDLGIYCRAGWWQAAGSLTSPAHHILQSSRQKTETQSREGKDCALQLGGNDGTSEGHDTQNYPAFHCPRHPVEHVLWEKFR